MVEETEIEEKERLGFFKIMNYKAIGLGTLFYFFI